MADFIGDESQNQACHDQNGSPLFQESSPLNPFYPQMLEPESNFDQIDINLSQSTKSQRGSKPKKRSARFDRLGQRATNKDRRDIKKYAKFDTMEQIFQNFSKEEPDWRNEHLKIIKQHKICKRSHKYCFVGLGVLRNEGKLEQFLSYFRANFENTSKLKYSNRTQYFKNFLLASMNYTKKAIQLILQNKEEDAIAICYSENDKGLKGRTKNPTQMEKCQRFYQSIFTIHHRSNLNDLDMFLN